jgi:hypothetical protein
VFANGLLIVQMLIDVELMLVFPLPEKLSMQSTLARMGRLRLNTDYD